jgi:hypothetical protein
MLAPVVIGRSRSESDIRLLRHATALAAEMWGRESFRAVAHAAAEVLAEQRACWDFGRFLARLAQVAGPALAAWRAEIAAAERELAAYGLLVEAVPAAIHAIEGRECLVAVPGRAVPQRYALAALTWKPEPGEHVVVERVEAGTQERDFLLPPLVLEDAPAPDVPRAPLADDTGSGGREPGMRRQSVPPPSRRLAAVTARAASVTSSSDARQAVDWRAQFERGYLGVLAAARPRSAARSRTPEHRPTLVLSRPLDRPVFS